MIGALAAALALAATEARLETSVSAGAGFETNLNHLDPDEAALPQEDAAFVALRASAGLALDLGERTGLYGGLRLDADEYLTLQDLSTATVGAEASLVRELGERWAVVLSPMAFASWSGDASRDVTGVGGQLTLRVRPVPRLALRGFYGYTRRDADDAVYSSERNRVGASVEVRAGEDVYLSLGWTGERGGEVYYRPLAGAVVMGRMGGGPVSSFGQDLEAYRLDSDSHAVVSAIEIGLGATAHLRASWEVRLVGAREGDGEEFVTQAVFAGLGVRR